MQALSTLRVQSRDQNIAHTHVVSRKEYYFYLEVRQ